MNRHLVSRMHLGIACLLIASLTGIATLRFALTTTGFNSTLSINAGAADRPVVQEALNRLPLLFEPNLGQADQAAHFIARTNGADAFLGPTSAVFVLKGEARANQRLVQAAHKINSKQALSPSFSVQIRGGNPRASSTGLNQLAGKSNYILGNKPAAWRTGVPNYAKVQFSNVYPGIDLVYYGNQRQLEYDFVVAPGADPSAIRLAFGGVESLQISPQGDLLVRVAGREVVQKRPFIYQEVDGKKSEVQGTYALIDNKEVAFHVEGYDKKLALIIDPVLVYSTYFGGGGWDGANGIAVDGSGSVYVVGTTNSLDLPIAHAAQPAAHSGSYDSFIAKMNPDGSGLIYSTYFGGSGDDYISAIAVDQSGNVYAIGTTSSADLPTVKPLQATYGGGIYDAFIVKLNQDGSVGYSTYLGGSDEDDGSTIAVDSTGSVYATGFTSSSTDFPTVKPIQSAFGGGAYDAFVAKINPAGSALVYSTYLGGGQEDDGFAIAVDSAGNAYVAGMTVSPDFPAVGAAQATYGGGPSDGFAAKLNAAGSALTYSTFIGGSNADVPFAIAVDGSGAAFITGNTSSVDFPTTPGAFQRSNGGNYDAFVSKLSPSGSALVFSTYLGGSADDTASGIKVDDSGSVYLAGNTSSPNYPVAGSLKSFGGGMDAFVSKLNSSGTALTFSTFLGGTKDDSASGLALDSSGNAYVAGTTSSSDFPTIRPFQKALAGGGSDSFIAKIGSRSPSISSVKPASGPIAGGNTVTIAGTNFLPGASVSFGGIAASQVNVSNLGTIVATVPAHSAGMVDVAVTSADGQSATPAAAYAYIGPPSVSNISPDSGPIGGGSAITVTGSNFAAGAAVSLGGVPATDVVVGDGTITAVAPAHASGAVDVVVTNPDGQSGVLAGGFTYVALLSDSQVVPPAVAPVDPVPNPSSMGCNTTGSAPSLTLVVLVLCLVQLKTRRHLKRKAA